MSEGEPKRLAPTKEVLRELYLKSGNQCAYPSCTRLIINVDGCMIGEICHIEAAMPDGQRFNAYQSNDERRCFDNLLLLCHEHHKITDDESTYTVERLKRIKSDHEKKFSDIPTILQQSIIDVTTLSDYKYTKYCKKMNDFFNWGLTEEQIEECSKEINLWIDELRKLPLATRQVFSIMIQRSTQTTPLSRVSFHEIEMATAQPQCKIIEHYEILERYGFLSSVDEDIYQNPVCYIKNFKSGWSFWKDLVKYTAAKAIPIDEFVVNLQFSNLD